MQLVEDIIQSFALLDEGADDMQRENIDLYTLAEKAVQSLGATGKYLIFPGAFRRSGSLTAYHSFYTVIYNFCDNAIKYNHENGK